MPFDDLEFKSKAQAEKLREVFAKRYGDEDGLKKWEEVASKSPSLEDLPERVEKEIKPLYKKKKVSVSRKFGKRWRSA